MALTPTITIPLGFDAPAFSLTDVRSGKLMTFDDCKGIHGTLVIFICNHCPYVTHIIRPLVNIAAEYAARGIHTVAICSNDEITYPQDGPDKMKLFALEQDFAFPYLHDATQEVAKLYDAACTPDLNVFDAKGKCVYRGQFDSSRPGNNLPVNGEDLRNTFELLLQGKTIPEQGQRPSTGCNIKWKNA
jgi:peroxiredoxin